MELFLNLVWLLIATVLLCTWRTQWIHERRGGIRHRVREWSAVSLALVLLFFAVSMSDDMHSEIVALEESSLSKRESVCSPNAHPLLQSGTPVQSSAWAIVPRLPSCDIVILIQNVEPFEQFRASFPPIQQPSGRAPPVSI